ncbi:alpha-mannosidase [Halorhabdus amylolytica]|uniref:alpha-mannosidase n=1 Tax=Halorhabdus amylolytica TaxID=2559573 RepID=UPI0010A9FAC1|nr:glycoside hydrolase family 38 C-terminal domain-containing protein [Halorhabdus amylolytica]
MTETVLERRANAAERRLDSLSTYETAAIEDISRFETTAFATPEELQLDEFEPCDVGFVWERDRETTPADRREADIDPLSVSKLPTELAVGQNVWFRLRGSIPDSMAGHPVDLRFVAAPVNGPDEGLGTPRVECLCYRNGEPCGAFDDGHAEIRLTESASGGESFDVLVEAGTTTLWGQLDVDRFVLETAELLATRERVRDLHRNVAVLNDLQAELPDDSINREKILRAIQNASHTFDYQAADERTYRTSADSALETLDELKTDVTSELTGHELTAVGHAHIDLAWLWPWSETVRKGARSFSTVLGLLDTYPSFRFLQSQPHLYELVRDRYPAVYERITEQIEKGGWDPVGALWVEADVNISGPEALARQFLYGKRHFRDAFGEDPQTTFLPDVFGYTATLPTIARAADCPYFLTQKMSWNETNEFPYTSFTWSGLDGSSVLAHFPPADTYNGDMSVEQVREAVTNDDESAVTERGLYLYGWGDGGGGPTREMIERREVIDEIGSMPDVSHGSLREFFDGLADYTEQLPTWDGEMYLEKHRGTLTTQARTKRNNRKGENALRDAELVSLLAHARVDAFEYPHSDLESAWKVLLFNQFHDILPGSSVTEVYADADRDYETVFETAETERDRALRALGGEPKTARTVAVSNPLSWSYSPIVDVDAETLSVEKDRPPRIVDASGTPVPTQLDGRSEDRAFLFEATDLPPLGAKTFTVEEGKARTVDSSLTASSSHLENDRLRVEFDDDGTYTVTDLRADREPFEGTANRLVRYRDQPDDFDAWDVEGDFAAVSEQLPPPDDVSVLESGPLRATVRQRFEFGDSTLVQDVSLTRGSARIDHRTVVDWHEDEQLLKTRFPVDVRAREATFDVQFGHVERATHENTSWDSARFEVPHQQWVDVSEEGYGVAVLNDCKYGVDVDGTDIGLSLLRAPASPDPQADRHEHEFTYAVYPHADGPIGGDVVEAGYELNALPDTVPVRNSIDASLASLDTSGVVVESVKRAEDDRDALVVRLYEAYGRRTDATLSFDVSITDAESVSIVEDTRESLDVTDDSIDLSLDAFELRSIKVDLEEV